MCPCSPNDVTITPPSAPSGPSIPGFGIPFALKVDNIFVPPKGFPEDLINIFQSLQLLVPPGVFKPQLSLNFGKDIFDALLSIFDKFMPFLMLYKFFLPALNLVLCILEVICAFPNPEKMIKALIRLFRNCIPEFLNMFPVFALITMIISVLALLLSLIEYVVEQIIKLVDLILTNLAALDNAFNYADAEAILAIANKIGATLCIFQNLFVLFQVFNLIFQVYKELIQKIFSLPPCGDTGPDSCCSSDVCPAIVKTEYTRTSAFFKYLRGLELQDPSAPAPFNELKVVSREESWQLFDSAQEIQQAFSNIYDAYDVNLPYFIKPKFFPTYSSYSAETPPNQAAYTIDLRLFYNPADWGRTGVPRYIRFNDCIMLQMPTNKIKNYDNTNTKFQNGVVKLGGGLGYEDDGTTILYGFDVDGVTPNSDQATLNNFLHKSTITAVTPVYNITDGYTFLGTEYKFKPNIAALVGANLITAGCAPELAINTQFINTVFASDAAIKLQGISNILNNGFPDMQGAQDCINTGLINLRNNLTRGGVAEFQSLATVCLNKLKDDTKKSLLDIIALGFEPCNSTIEITPQIQFTTKKIKVFVDLKDKNSISLCSNLPAEIGDELSKKLKGYTTLGEIDSFVYDGYQLFTSEISSDKTGSGELMVSFENNIFCINTIPADITIPPTRDLQEVPYQFVYAPVGGTKVGEGDTSDGKPRYTASDVSGGNKDNV